MSPMQFLFFLQADIAPMQAAGSLLHTVINPNCKRAWSHSKIHFELITIYSDIPSTPWNTSQKPPQVQSWTSIKSVDSSPRNHRLKIFTEVQAQKFNHSSYPWRLRSKIPSRQLCDTRVSISIFLFWENRRQHWTSCISNICILKCWLLDCYFPYSSWGNGSCAPSHLSSQGELSIGSASSNS